MFSPNTDPKQVKKVIQDTTGSTTSNLRARLRDDLIGFNQRVAQKPPTVFTPSTAEVKTTVAHFNQPISPPMTHKPALFVPEYPGAVGGGGDGGSSVSPFRVIDVGAGQYTVEPGTVNTIVPTTVGGTADWTFEPDLSTTKFIYLKATLDTAGANVTDASLEIGSTVPITATGDPYTGGSPTYAYRPVAKILTSGAIEQYVIRSQWVYTVVSSFECDTMQRSVVWSEGGI